MMPFKFVETADPAEPFGGFTLSAIKGSHTPGAIVEIFEDDGYSVTFLLGMRGGYGSEETDQYTMRIDDCARYPYTFEEGSDAGDDCPTIRLTSDLDPEFEWVGAHCLIPVTIKAHRSYLSICDGIEGHTGFVLTGEGGVIPSRDDEGPDPEEDADDLPFE